jgi:hypothetical protein
VKPFSRTLLIAMVMAVACKGDGGKGRKLAQPNQPARPSTPPAVLPPMPRYPEAGRGHMAVISAAASAQDTITRDWPAEAGTCVSPPMLLVKSEREGVGGTLLLLALPANKITSYPVTTVTRGLPVPPAAQVGVQAFSQSGSQAFQATEGSADIYSFGKTVSGRFAVTLREINRNERIQYAGAFREVTVLPLDPKLCAPAAAGAAPAPK